MRRAGLEVPCSNQLRNRGLDHGFGNKHRLARCPAVKEQGARLVPRSRRMGERSELGCPYLDVRCKERGAHLLVFGHRLGRSHHMFTELAGTHEQSTFDAIGNATWNSRAGSEVFEPVLSLVVDKDDALIQRFEFDSPSELRDWLTDLLARSAAHTGNASDIALEARRALTLVTCAEARRGGRRRTLVVFATR